MAVVGFGILRPGDVRKLDTAIGNLQALAADPERLDVLQALQTFLLRRICSRERAISRVRKLERRLRQSLRSGALDKAEAKQVKSTVRECGRRIEMARGWIFLWKCFGDGAACVYQSPYNLKQLFYDKDYNVKEDAGFITGKAGLEREWAILESGIAAGVPVVLADLTNMIRTGDLCALGGPDPVPIEIKTGTATGARAARQQRSLEEVAAFFDNDGAGFFRGMHNVARKAVSRGPCYEDEMNACIGRALAEGTAVVSPEPGLHYFAIAGANDVGPDIAALLQPATLVRGLTPDPGWLPCLPFTLTLARRELLAFIAGKVAVFVAIDMAYLKSLFLQHGTHATMVMDGDCAMQLCLDPNDLMRACFRVSELLFARVGLEFQSIAWFAQQHALKTDAPVHSMTQEEFQALPEGSYCTELPQSWVHAKDFFADSLTATVPVVD